MERVIKTIWKVAEPAKDLIESALELMVGSQAVLWCAYLVRESDSGWRVVAGNGVGAPVIGEIWPPEVLQRTRADGTTGGGLFYKPIRLPGKEPHHSGMSALVLAQPAPEHAQRATLHTTLHRLFDRLHDLLSHLPLVHHDPIVDSLSGTLTQAATYHRLQEEVARSHRYGGDLSVLLIDVDGTMTADEEAEAHSSGNVVDDEVLRVVGYTLRQNLRQMDTAGRYGRDTFLVLLPETGAEEALQAGQRLGQIIGKAIIETDNPAQTRANGLGTDPSSEAESTPSARLLPGANSGADEREATPAYELRIGAASYPASARKPMDLLAQAEEALREARRNLSGPWLRHALRDLNVTANSGFQCVCRHCRKIFEVSDRAHQRARRFCSHTCYVEARRQGEQSRDETIRELRRSGQSLRAIGQRFSLSPERVRQICQV